MEGKMFSVTNHQGNANQAIIWYNLTLIRMAIIKKITDNQCWHEREEKELEYTIGKNVN